MFIDGLWGDIVMVGFQENIYKANKKFSLYYQTAMDWIAENIEDIKKYSIEFPYRKEEPVAGITSYKFFITVELKNGFFTCLMAEVTIYDKHVLDEIRGDIKFRYSNWNYDISNIGQECKIDCVNDYEHMLNTIRKGDML